MRPLGAETIPLSEALGRILACAVIADVDVPGFDRSSVDGFAVRANDTTGASERQPKPLVLNAEILTPGMVPAIPVLPGTATLIATGGMVPRGADAVVMVEEFAPTAKAAARISGGAPLAATPARLAEPN